VVNLTAYFADRGGVAGPAVGEVGGEVHHGRRFLLFGSRQAVHQQDAKESIFVVGSNGAGEGK
jgi:hypothetical protein